jgi:hypothetical protein
VLDVSRGGVGAASSEAMGPSEKVLLFFPPLGAGMGSDIEGRVVRCSRTVDRFSVGIVFDHPWPERDEARSSVAESPPARSPDYL